LEKAVQIKSKMKARRRGMAKITEDMIIADVLAIDKSTAPIFLKHGMHCLGCPSASGETISDACAAHGIDPVRLVEELNAYLENK
jgi:hybrid cluster-associated redox disulfide protein